MDIDSLLDVLRRAGLPQSFLLMIDGMLRDIHDSANGFDEVSEVPSQLAGSSQGCTLSPLFFIAAMSALLRDAVG